MNKLGLNLFLWTTDGGSDDLTETLAFVKQTGFDHVEVPIGRPDVEAFRQLGGQLDALGLDRLACAICGPEHDLISPDAAVRRAAVTHLKAVVDCTRAMGATLLSGPFYAAFKTFTGRPATTDAWNRSVEGVREVADYAAERDVTLAPEYLNRFETYLLTCADDLIRYVEAVAHPACRLMYDTFHGHIEEKAQAEALRRCAPYLAHIQFSENDRSIPGTGQVDFGALLRVIQEIQYTGPITIEAFGLTPPDLAAAAHIVRRLFDSPEQLATDGYTFLMSENSILKQV